jgi:FkbM family methyltransferase
MLRLSGLGRPQYLFRPSQIFRRLMRELRSNPQDRSVQLPWGLELALDPTDTVGHALLSQGTYDLVTTELAWRLTERGDRTADIGANIGYMTGLLAVRAGAAGSVLAFEPFPDTFAILQCNVERWNSTADCACVSPWQGAVSDREGTATLVAHQAGDPNASHAFLAREETPGGIQVAVWTFARFLANGERFGVVKVDTESHEECVFAGMGGALKEGRIRDILFEEQKPYPAASHAALRNAGYAIFACEERLSGPRLVPPEKLTAPKRRYDILPNYLATRNPDRVKGLLSPSGWQCLRG